jgi:hypothetical protein
MVSLLTAQECNNQNVSNNKDLQLQKEQGLRDSLITAGINKGVESSNSELFKSLSAAFANQYLKIDTLQNTIKVIRDSLNTSVTYNYAQDDPTIIIESDGISLNPLSSGKYEGSIKFNSCNAGSKIIKTNSYVLAIFNNHTYYYEKIDPLSEGQKIPINYPWIYFFSVIDPSGGKTTGINKVFLCIDGTYTNMDSTKTYNINDAYVYVKTKNETSVMRKEDRVKLKQATTKLLMDNSQLDTKTLIGLPM